MDWNMVPWASIITLFTIAAGWLWRLQHLASRNADRLKDVERDVGRHGEEIAGTNSRITVTEKQIIELGAKAITRDDLREIKTELSEQINAVAVRMEKAVDGVRDDLRSTTSSKAAS